MFISFFSICNFRKSGPCVSAPLWAEWIEPVEQRNILCKCTSLSTACGILYIRMLYIKNTQPDGLALRQLFCDLRGMTDSYHQESKSAQLSRRKTKTLKLFKITWLKQCVPAYLRDRSLHTSGSVLVNAPCLPCTAAFYQRRSSSSLGMHKVSPQMGTAERFCLAACRWTSIMSSGFSAWASCGHPCRRRCNFIK